MNNSELISTHEDCPLQFNTWESITTKASRNSTVVAWLDDELRIDSFVKFNDYFKDKDVMLIQRLRIFSKETELLVWRSNGALMGRLRDDTVLLENGCKPMEFTDVDQLLWGTLAKEESDYITLTEDRGTNLKIPKFFKGDVDKDKRIFIKTRNYIDYTPAQHATYVDHRFVEFVVEK